MHLRLTIWLPRRSGSGAVPRLGGESSMGLGDSGWRTSRLASEQIASQKSHLNIDRGNSDEPVSGCRRRSDRNLVSIPQYRSGQFRPGCAAKYTVQCYYLVVSIPQCRSGQFSRAVSDGWPFLGRRVLSPHIDPGSSAVPTRERRHRDGNSAPLLDVSILNTRPRQFRHGCFPRITWSFSLRSLNPSAQIRAVPTGYGRPSRRV